MSSESSPFDLGLDDRCALIVDVTLDTLRDDQDLLLCEGLRLIEAARSAVARMAPAVLEAFEAHLVPQMRGILLERFGVCHTLGHGFQ